MHVEQAINFQGRQSTICIFRSRFGKFFFWWGAGGNTPKPGLVPSAHPGQRGVIIAGSQCMLHKFQNNVNWEILRKKEIRLQIFQDGNTGMGKWRTDRSTGTQNTQAKVGSTRSCCPASRSSGARTPAGSAGTPEAPRGSAGGRGAAWRRRRGRTPSAERSYLWPGVGAGYGPFGVIFSEISGKT